LPYVPGAFERLVDSGSSDCFMDPDFVTKNRLSYQEIAPFPVTLIDGTISTYVTSAILLPIELTCSYTCILECFIMKLEDPYSIALGHNWLIQYNPIID